LFLSMRMENGHGLQRILEAVHVLCMVIKLNLTALEQCLGNGLKGLNRIESKKFKIKCCLKSENVHH
jgi:hypothetical protein